MAQELGIGLVASSPLGQRCFLAPCGIQISSPRGCAATPARFYKDKLARNLKLVAEVEAIEAERKIKPARLALSWFLHQGDDVVAIPGSRRREHLEESVAALEISFSSEDLARLDRAGPRVRQLARDVPTSPGCRHSSRGSSPFWKARLGAWGRCARGLDCRRDGGPWTWVPPNGLWLRSCGLRRQADPRHRLRSVNVTN